MTSVREDLGYLPREPRFPKPKPVAQFWGARDLGRDEWPKQWEAIVSVPRPGGGDRIVNVYDADKDKAINRARSLVAVLNRGSR